MTDWLIVFIYRMLWYIFQKDEGAQKFFRISVRQNLLEYLLSAAIDRESSSSQKNRRWPYDGARGGV